MIFPTDNSHVYAENESLILRIDKWVSSPFNSVLKRKIKRILCPIDFDDASINAIAYSANLAKVLDASLTIWNIREVPIIEEMSSAKGRYLDFKQKEEDLNNILQDWCEEIREEHNITCGYTVRPSWMNLKQTINHYTDGRNYDLVVLGTNGKDDNYNLFFEKGGRQIIKFIRCHLLIVPDGWSYESIDSIVFASDLLDKPQQLPIDLMRTFQSNMTLLQLGATNHNHPLYVEQKKEELMPLKLDQAAIRDWENTDVLFKWLSNRKDDLLVLHTKDKSWVENTLNRLFSNKPNFNALPAMFYFAEKTQEKKGQIGKETLQH